LRTSAKTCTKIRNKELPVSMHDPNPCRHKKFSARGGIYLKEKQILLYVIRPGGS
jgi:hypothetical protein